MYFNSAITITMKLYLIAFITAFCCYTASAQQSTGLFQRNIRFDFIKGDSTRLSFNEEFNLIEDSCSQVYRYAHVDMQNRRYTGQFKDVSRADGKLTITQGAYNHEGLVDGPFIVNYLNGALQAKGNFKNGLFDGKWEVYYDNGKPKITFEANGKGVKIIDEWDSKGTKTVNDGNGTYRADMGFMYWQGKLLNGRPEGKWKSKKTVDNTDLTSEVYKNGTFIKGTTSFSEYTDAPRLVLISPAIFPFTTAEKFQISATPCNGTTSKSFVGAHYIGGTTAFSNHIGEQASSYLNTVDLKSFDSELTIEGEISERGNIEKLKSHNAFDMKLSQALMSKLRNLPNLEPATLGGKPVKQRFTITFKFNSGYYSFTYRFLPPAQ